MKNEADQPQAPTYEELLQRIQNLEQKAANAQVVEVKVTEPTAPTQPKQVKVKQWREVIDSFGDVKKTDIREQYYSTDEFNRMTQKDEKDKSQFDYLGMVVELIEE